jgi:hypothetical protein
MAGPFFVSSSGHSCRHREMFPWSNPCLLGRRAPLPSLA